MPNTQEITEPIVLDSTAQDIVTALQDLKDAVQPTDVYVDLDVSLLASGWSSSAPYLYNWTSDRVTTECAVKVSFLDGADDTDQLYIGYEKVAGGIQFEAPTKPTQNIPVRVRIINAEAGSVTSITDEMVSTATTPNASNVKQALTKVNSDIGTLNEQIVTLPIKSIQDAHIVAGNFTWSQLGNVYRTTISRDTLFDRTGLIAVQILSYGGTPLFAIMDSENYVVLVAMGNPANNEAISIRGFFNS